MVTVPLFVISNIALFLVNFSCINKVLWVPLSNILTIASPEISSIHMGPLLLLIFVPWVLKSHGSMEIWIKTYSKT